MDVKLLSIRVKANDRGEGSESVSGRSTKVRAVSPLFNAVKQKSFAVSLDPTFQATP